MREREAENPAPEFHTINLEEVPPPVAQTYTPNLWEGMKRRLSDTWDSVVNRTATGAPQQ